MTKFVIKRSGEFEEVCFDKITTRIEKLCFGLNTDFVNVNDITRRVKDGMSDNMTTQDIDELAAAVASSNSPLHPDYGLLAGRILASNLQKMTKSNFSDVICSLYNYHDIKTGRNCQLIADDVYTFIMENMAVLNNAIDDRKDFTYDYFAFKTLERSYLLKVNGKVVERPQHMLMRVAAGINTGDLDGTLECYRLMSDKMFTMATPTLFNAGTVRPQMSSCFLVHMEEDSITGIYDTLKKCAVISKHAGGIGLSIHDIRATGSYIAGTNGNSNGIVPMLRVFNDTARYVDQGGGKRKGSIAIYLEPWHADIEDFLLLKRNFGKEEQRARDLFYALWIPDLFMQRVREPNGKWTLFSPDEAPGLSNVYGDDFVTLYTQYEKEGRGKTIDALYLFKQVINSQQETGVPYILFKDHVNRKSNQKNRGTIKSSNLCCEIMEYTSPEETAVCNLASINFNILTDAKTKKFDFDKLRQVTRVAVRNLNRVIDRNYYPTECARRSNMMNRPIGLGVQGLADVFHKLDMPFDSPEAIKLDQVIFEHMYFAALQESIELAKKDGPYETFKGSPFSEGKVQYDLWGMKDEDLISSITLDWKSLKKDLVKYGARNSLLTTVLPSASTSQILGNTECIEPIKSLIFTRRTIAGEFPVVNRIFIEKMVELGLWNKEVTYLDIDANNGSVQGLPGVPAQLQKVFKTIWEIPQKSIIDHALARGRFIDQSQSMNLFFDKNSDDTSSKISSALFYGWSKGIKTGSYYIRTQPKVQAKQFTVQDQQKKQAEEKRVECTDDVCMMCSG